MAMHESVADRRSEFDAHLWDHASDPFQMGFDVRRPLAEHELVVLDKLAAAIASGDDDANVASALRRLLVDDPDAIFAVMQLVGLTRNKIIVDLKAATAALGVAIPGRPEGLPRSSAAWKYAGPYLVTRLRKVLEPIAALRPAARRATFEAVNQATYSGWIRQERAKRQGHEAEHRVAVLLFSLGIEFVPEEKAENPLCRDQQIGGISYDLVVPNAEKPVLVMKSTVQTANIGQFGESKADLEVVQAQASLAQRYPKNRPVLVAMIDGVGFRSNTQGLHGVLGNADEFAQFKTIWKIPVVAAARLGLSLTVALPAGHAREHADFLSRYASEQLTVAELTEEFRAAHNLADLIEAGEAVLLRA
jgi:hypothetical protein